MSGPKRTVWLGGRSYLLEVAVDGARGSVLSAALQRLAWLQLAASPAMRPHWQPLLAPLRRRFQPTSWQGVSPMRRTQLRPVSDGPGARVRLEPAAKCSGGEQAIGDGGSHAGGEKTPAFPAEPWPEAFGQPVAQARTAVRLFGSNGRPIQAAVQLAASASAPHTYLLGDPLQWDLLEGLSATCTLYRFQKAVRDGTLDAFT